MVRAVPTSLVILLLLATPSPAQQPSLTTTNPVTGKPQFNVISQEQEIQNAHQSWARLRDEAEARGYAVDPIGERLSRVRRVFKRLVAVAHRQDLPWMVHLIEVPTPNAQTPGGGTVWIFGGAFGGLIEPETDENKLAAILGHEIAHVTLLHIGERQTQLGIGAMLDSDVDDPYYQAAFSTEQEAHADEIGVLYAALAGFNPMSAHVLWEDAHRKRGSSAAAQGFLNTHPVNAQRMASTYAAASKVSQYRIPGKQNPRWEALLQRNALYTKIELPKDGPGAGTARTLGAALDAYLKHRAARDEQRERERAAQTLSNLQFGRQYESWTQDRKQAVFIELYNPGPRTITGFQAAVDYLSGQRLIYTDTECGGTTSISPGNVGHLGCYKKAVPGAFSWQIRLVDIGVE